MVSGTIDVLAPKALMLPNRRTHTISGANGEICISGSEVYFYDGAGKWIGLHEQMSGAKVITV